VNYLAICAALGVSLAAGLAAYAPDPPPASREAADSLARKISLIRQRGEMHQRAAKRVRTAVTEAEVNGYLAHEMADDFPAGVVSPSVTLHGSGRVTGRAVVDLDRVRQQSGATSILNPMRYLTGRLPVTGTGMLRTVEGRAQFLFESANVSGVPVPKVVLQQIVGYYSRSERFPSGVSLDDPFDLPAGIREIEFGSGRAVVIQ
jgi:hypothetical protein